MVHIYKSKEHENVFYYQMLGIVGLDDALKLGSHIRKYYSNKTNVISIMVIDDEAVLSHKAFITEVAKINHEYKNVFKRTHVVGVTGIRKFFYKTYQLLTPSNPIEVVLENSVSDIEKKYNISFKNDFDLC